MKIKFFFIFFLIFFFTNSFSILAKNKTEIVVKIENELITNYDIKSKIISSLLLTKKEVNQKNINELKRRSLENLIQNRLKKIELSKYNFKRDDKKINDYLNSISSNNIENLKNLFKKNDIDFQAYVDEIDIQFKWRNYIYQKYSKRIEINQIDVEKEIQEIMGQQKSLVEYNLSEIEIVSNNDDSDKIKINQVQKEIESSDFETAVLKYSISPSSTNDGQLGWISSRSLSDDFIKIVNNMSVGEVSKPIVKKNKITFLKLNDKKTVNSPQVIKEELKQILINKKKNELFNLYSNSYLSKLRNSQFIEYFK